MRENLSKIQDSEFERFEKGLELLQQKKFPEALKLFRRIEKNCRIDLLTLTKMQIGIVYIKLKEYVKAKKEFTELKETLEKNIQTVDNFLKFCGKMIEKQPF